jgi:hypothetical protein
MKDGAVDIYDVFGYKDVPKENPIVENATSVIGDIETVPDGSSHIVAVGKGVIKSTEDYQKFAREKLGIEFKDVNLLISALTHTSRINKGLPTGEHKNIRYWNMPDPQYQSIEFHRKVRDAVKLKVNRLVEEIG